jgi:hypothetical protein
MTDVTSPVAKLSARLPKGNGFSRAVPELYHRRGDLVFFVGAMRIEETGLDRNDVEKVLASIERFELAAGPTVADVKDLLTIASTQATTVKGQMSLLNVDHEHDEEIRAGLIRDLIEWGTEQQKPLDVTGLTDMWNSWHGGFYDARLEKAPVRHLREFAIQKGVLPDDMASQVDTDQDGDLLGGTDEENEAETLNAEGREDDYRDTHDGDDLTEDES